MNKIESILVGTICRLNEVIRKLEAENKSLQRQLEETHSALVATEIRENDLLEIRKEAAV